MIEEKNWSKIQLLIEDVKLTLNNLVLLVYTIYEEKENKAAREAFFKADELYDFNSTERPNEICNICQQTVAEVLFTMPLIVEICYTTQIPDFFNQGLFFLYN